MDNGVSLNDNEDRFRIYENFRKDLLESQRLNSSDFDKAILTLSTAGLGVSITFIKDIIPLDSAECIILLKLSWVLFALSIISTIFSLMLSQYGLKKQLHYAEKFYIDDKREYFNKSHPVFIAVELFNVISGLVFIAAISLTVVFIISNL